VSPPTISVSDAASQSEIVVTTDQRCEWKAVADAGWIRLAPASGAGGGRVTVDIAANPAPAPRSSTVRIGQQSVSLTQGGVAVPECGDSLRIQPEKQDVSVDGGSFTATVSAREGCAWTVASDSWISPSPTSGAGTASLTYTVTANSSLPRSGTIRVGNRSLAVAQAGCSFRVGLSPQTVPQGGGSITVGVTTGTACTWTASRAVTWIEPALQAGRGTTQVSFKVTPNTGGARSGRITVADQSIEFRQEPAEPTQPSEPSPCPASVTPPAASFPASGGTREFSVTAGGDCKWSPSSRDAWIKVSGGTAGAGGGTIAVGSNTGGGRKGSVQIGQRSIDVSQEAAPCTYGVGPQVLQATADGGTFAVTIKTASHCGWSAASNADWVTPRRASGTGTATVQVSVARSDSLTARETTITSSGGTIRVTQAARLPAGRGEPLPPGTTPVPPGTGPGVRP
jgi:hypothetical protein